MPRIWTPEQRARQAENCRKTRPWVTATGPRTLEGKESSRLNAVTHGLSAADAHTLRKRQARLLVRLLIRLQKIRDEKNELSTKSLESLDSLSNACNVSSHEQNEE